MGSDEPDEIVIVDVSDRYTVKIEQNSSTTGVESLILMEDGDYVDEYQTSGNHIANALAEAASTIDLLRYVRNAPTTVSMEDINRVKDRLPGLRKKTIIGIVEALGFDVAGREVPTKSGARFAAKARTVGAVPHEFVVGSDGVAYGVDGYIKSVPLDEMSDHWTVTKVY